MQRRPRKMIAQQRVSKPFSRTEDLKESIADNNSKRKGEQVFRPGVSGASYRG
jgi:hypothetical protein